MVNFPLGERMVCDCPRCDEGVIDFGIKAEEAPHEVLIEATCDSCGRTFGVESYRQVVFQQVGPWSEPWQGSRPPKGRPARKPTPRDGFVYFVRSPSTGHVKIGFSANPKARIDSLQTAHGSKLELLALRRGTTGDERDLHRRFRAQRVKGEWFESTPELLAEVERCS